MKKMIPVYLLQIAILAVVAFVGFQLLREVQTLRADLESVKQPANQVRRVDDAAIRVVNTR